MTCTFFGHRFVPQKIEPTLRSTLIDLIENHGVDLFYVGNHGDFDAMVHRVLRDQLSEQVDDRAIGLRRHLHRPRRRLRRREFQETG